MNKKLPQKYKAVRLVKNYVVALEGLGKEVWDALGGADKYIHGERASWRQYSDKLENVRMLRDYSS